MTVFFGDDIRDILSTLPLYHDESRVAVFHGTTSYVNCHGNELIDSLPVEPDNLFTFEVRQSNPDFFIAKKAIEFVKSHSPDLVIAFGGGTVIDIAKVALSYYQSEIEDDLAATVLEKNTEEIDFIVIPTTSGSGAEITPFATVYSNLEKYSLACPYSSPKYIVLEADNLHSLPSYQLSCSVLDALSQSIESIWAKNSTVLSDSYAKTALALLRPLVQNVIKNNHDDNIKSEICDELMLAGYFSGKAIAISRTTAAHAYSYYLTSHHGISHGHAVAICMTAILRYHRMVEDSQIAKIEKLILNTFFDKEIGSLLTNWEVL